MKKVTEALVFVTLFFFKKRTTPLLECIMNGIEIFFTDN